MPIDDVVTAKADVLRLFGGKEGRSNVQAGRASSRRARHWARQLPARTRYAEPFEIIRVHARAGI